MYKINKIGFCRFFAPGVVKLGEKIWGKFLGAPHFQIRLNFPNLIFLPSKLGTLSEQKRSYFLTFRILGVINETCKCSAPTAVKTAFFVIERRKTQNKKWYF
jgi:hypothetical protein